MNNRWRQKKKLGKDFMKELRDNLTTEFAKAYQIPRAFLEYPNLTHDEEIKDQFIYKYLMTLRDARRKRLTLEAVNSFISEVSELLKERKENSSI